MDFYDRVKQLCKSQKKTIEEVAQKAGITLSTYNSKKRYNILPKADEAVIMAKELNTTVEYLVTGETPEVNPAKEELTELKRKLLELSK